ncbi:MAG: hypothetical protein H0W36_10180 [Gemmatimonadetes bacterium]|nr:hypothetical protein [Gemmatimonadota bacterium]
MLSHDADLLETAIGPERAQRAAADSTLRLISYPSAAYGFLGFNLYDRQRRGPHPLLADREHVGGSRSQWIGRCWLGRCSVKRPRRRRAPMSRLLWIWSDSIRILPYDTAVASKTLDAAGWRRRDGESVRRRGSQRLRFDILVPSTSGSRRQLAVQLQEPGAGSAPRSR